MKIKYKMAAKQDWKFNCKLKWFFVFWCHVLNLSSCCQVCPNWDQNLPYAALNLHKYVALDLLCIALARSYTASNLSPIAAPQKAPFLHTCSYCTDSDKKKFNLLTNDFSVYKLQIVFFFFNHWHNIKPLSPKHCSWSIFIHAIHMI